ncbi:MAG: CRISPR system precrRNA processing endoribonuclease RAMP protein Cas6 [Acidobacteria bacterium]|nr:CRISPR system precrRNA processing endoribonuclease RAMP protein Cas6 [Acidobacteriota bacterium]
MFRFSKVELGCESLAASPAPVENLGAQLRGGFGAVLHGRLCRHEHAETCGAQLANVTGCEYLRLFKPCRCVAGETLAGRPLGNQHNLPAPFVISALPDAGRGVQAGERFSFEFVSFGALCDSYWYPVAAFEEFGAQGLRRRDGTRTPFRVVAVKDQLAGGRSLFSERRLCPPVARDIEWTVGEWLPAVAPTALEVAFLTPLSVRWARARRRDAETGLALFVDFYDLVRAVLDRVAALWQLYGPEWRGQAEYYRWYNQLLAAARPIQTLQADLRIERGERYSHAHEKDLPLTGFVGKMQFAGDFTPFLELLMIGETVHLGQQTTNGLGRYSLLF